MANKRSGWNPKQEVSDMYRRKVNNPSKIDAVQNRLRTWDNGFVDNGATRLNDRENGEGITRRKKNTRETEEQIRKEFTKNRKRK